jgi:hypothetical protein
LFEQVTASARLGMNDRLHLMQIIGLCLTRRRLALRLFLARRWHSEQHTRALRLGGFGAPPHHDGTLIERRSGRPQLRQRVRRQRFSQNDSRTMSSVQSRQIGTRTQSSLFARRDPPTCRYSIVTESVGASGWKQSPQIDAVFAAL